MNYDLHTHSTCSDGTCTPEELIKLASLNGLKGLSITDHDSIIAYPEALILGKKYNVKVLPGAEFSCHFDNKSVHILGYSFDYTNATLVDFCKRHQERRENRNRKILQKLALDKWVITEEELKNCAKGVVGRPHIAKLLMDKGYVTSIAEAFKRYIGDGKKYYVPGDQFTIEETLAIIHGASGFAILAHPHLFNDKKFAKKILELPFDGLEAEYSQMTAKDNLFWIAHANKHHLLMTGGSDFHGTIKPALQLGATQISEAQVKPLFERFYSHHPEFQL